MTIKQEGGEGHGRPPGVFRVTRSLPFREIFQPVLQPGPQPAATYCACRHDTCTTTEPQHIKSHKPNNTEVKGNGNRRELPNAWLMKVSGRKGRLLWLMKVSGRKGGLLWLADEGQQALRRAVMADEGQ